MDTTTLNPAAKIFAEQLIGLKYLFGIELQGESPGELLIDLGAKSKEDPALAKVLQKFFENPIHYSARFATTDNLFQSVVRTLVAVAVRGAIHDYGVLGAPVKQHWMPLAYLNSFGSKTSSGKRSIEIQGVSFADDFILDFKTRDSTFIHETVDGSGFYEDSAEYFFHLVENLYSQGRSGQKREIDHGLVALFFVVQAVRNPRYGSQFSYSSLSDIINAVLRNLDAVGPNMKAFFLNSNKSLPFTPYIPPFTTRDRSVEIYALPVSSKLLFVLSSEEVRPGVLQQIPKRYRDTVVQQAMARKSFVFGVSRHQISSITTNALTANE